jgi:hypothetical protein
MFMSHTSLHHVSGDASILDGPPYPVMQVPRWRPAHVRGVIGGLLGLADRTKIPYDEQEYSNTRISL